jgi:DNA polymerase-1
MISSSCQAENCSSPDEEHSARASYMNPNHKQMNTVLPLLDMLSSGVPVAVTAPLLLEDELLVGYYSAENSGCAVIPAADAYTISRMLYQPKTSSIRIHGLKRIWEVLHIGTREVNLDLVHDTKLMAYLLDPDAGDEGLTLSALAAQYLEEEYPHRILDIRDNGYPDAFYATLAYDAEIIWRLHEQLFQSMSKDLLRLYRETELPLMPILDEMRRTGIGVDGYTAIKELSRVKAEMSAIENAIKQGREVDLKSEKQVLRFLGEQGVRFVYPVRKITRSALEEIAHLHPVVQRLLEWRDLADDESVLDRAAGKTRVHPRWGQMSARTSRIYASLPAVQNISRELRYLFIPAPGNVFVKADYSQAQLRILAHLSEDENLVSLFNNGRDPHGETATWLGIDRDSAKQVNFGICFGMSAAGLAGRISRVRKSPVDVATAQAYIDTFYGRYPGVAEFFVEAWQELKAEQKGKRITTAPSGRIRRFDTRANRAVERKFRITLPQQIEADLIKTAMIRLDRIFRRRNMKAHIVMVIHDALWVEAPHEGAEQVRHLLRKMMTTAAKLRVPLEVDIK